MATEQSTDLFPAKAVREALGLSSEDAQEILGRDIKVDLFDTAHFVELEMWAKMAEGRAEIFLEIQNPDGSTFKKWRVTTEGKLEAPQGEQEAGDEQA